MSLELACKICQLNNQIKYRERKKGLPNLHFITKFYELREGEYNF